MKFIDYLNEMPKGIYKRKKKFPKDGFKKFIQEMEKSGHFRRYNGIFLYDMNFKYKNIVFPMEIEISIKEINEIGTLIFKLFANLTKPSYVDIVSRESYRGWFQIHLDQDEWSPEEYVERLLDEIEGDFQEDIKSNLKHAITIWTMRDRSTESEVLDDLKKRIEDAKE